jgi:hypothetical protein
MADERAKKAAEGPQSNSPLENLPPYLATGQLLDSVSAIKQAHKKDTKSRWERLWAKSPRYEHTKQIDPNVLSNSFTKLVANLPKRLISLYMYFRTHHISLNQHLHRIK